MMTLQEIKAAAAALPAEERSELVTWLNESEDVCEIRREQLRREIQHGIEQADHGELLEADEVFARLRAGLPTRD
jgi:predicted transcriptional regulator